MAPSYTLDVVAASARHLFPLFLLLVVLGGGEVRGDNGDDDGGYPAPPPPPPPFPSPFPARAWAPFFRAGFLAAAGPTFTPSSTQRESLGAAAAAA